MQVLLGVLLVVGLDAARLADAAPVVGGAVAEAVERVRVD